MTLEMPSRRPRLTVAGRLLLTLGAVMLLLLGPAVYALVQLAAIRDIASELAVQNTGAAMALGRLSAARSELERYQRSYVAAPAPEKRQRMHAAAARARAELRRVAQSGFPGAAAHARVWLDSLTRSDDSIDALVRRGQLDSATAFLPSVRSQFEGLDESLTGVARAIDRGGAERVAEAQRISAAATRTGLLAAVLGALVALGLGLWTTGVLARPMRRLRRAMVRVAGGSFEVPEDLPYARRDEIGDVARSFRTMAHRLSELDRVKAEFVSMASHEMKTPVSLIRGYVDLMEEALASGEPARSAELFDPVREQTRALGRLVDHLLEISRMEAGGFRISPEPVETRGFFSGLQKVYEPLAMERGIDFTIRVAQDAPETFLADPDCLRDEVIGNLLVNAFRFTPSGGQVAVAVEPLAGPHDELRIRVVDTGTGIAAEQLPFIFEKYWRAGHETGRVGAGLGLAIAREVVALHGGWIAADSDEGRGTSFEVVLPAGADRAAPPTASDAEQPPAPAAALG